MDHSISWIIHVQYSGELHTYGTNLKWIWISNSLYFKIRVNKNSHRFVIIKLQDIFGTSKNAFTWRFWPFCFVFMSLKNVKRQTFRLFIYLFTQPFTKLLIFQVNAFFEVPKMSWSLIITNLCEFLFTRILKYRLFKIQIHLRFVP